MPNPPKLPPAGQPKNQLGLPICGAGLRKKPGRTCQQPAGHCTDHQGAGRCWLHGGKTGRLTHGRYSQVHRKRMAQLYMEHQQDPDPLNIMPEIALGRGMLEDFLNRYADYTAALLAWHQSYLGYPSQNRNHLEALTATLDELQHLWATFDINVTEQQQRHYKAARDAVQNLAKANEGKPRQILDISTAHNQLDTITKMVERVEKVRAANAISRADMLRVMTEFGRAVDTFVHDDNTKQRIKEAWLAVHL